MATVNHPVVGAPKPDPTLAGGAVPLRLEIRDLMNNHQDQWNLYLLALANFQSVDEKSDLSYYGIAGIHGRPYRPWGGVKGNNSGGWQGYCTHSSILFAPWHRPYLALFEQTIYRIVQDIAGQFPESTRKRYQQAASTFRIPYWDWAADPPSGDSNFPKVVGQPTIAVVTPRSNGQSIQIPNPLYSYSFKPLNPVSGDFVEQPFQSWPSTLRYPSSIKPVNAVSDDDQAADAMASQFAGLQGTINILLNDPNYTDFAAFSNHAWQNSAPGTFASIEDVHNSIHVAVGGNLGHMSELDYSAFDPVFWLHHSNVDRLFAIWQALNPTSYTINKRAGDGTFAISRNSNETTTTPLAPFIDATGTKYWTSESVRQTEIFNYAYPETQRWAFPSDADYQNSVRSAIQQLYGSINNQFLSAQGFNSMAAPASTAADIKAEVENGLANGTADRPATAVGKVPRAQNDSANTGTASDKLQSEGQHSSSSRPAHSLINHIRDDFSGHVKDPRNRTHELDFESEIEKPSPAAVQVRTASSFTEYIVNIKTQKHIIGQSYRVHIFIGDFEPATNTWATQDALVGTFAAFGKDRDGTGCGKCQKDAEDHLVITGTVPLTAALVKEYQKGNLGSLDKQNVLPWLREHLHWRVTLADGTEKAREEVPGLKVSVVTTEVELPADGFPRYSGVYEVHQEVTPGRPAGCNVGDQI